MPEAACFNYTLSIRSIELQWQFFNCAIYQIPNMENLALNLLGDFKVAPQTGKMLQKAAGSHLSG